MRTLPLLALSLCLLTSAASAAVVRPAPDFTVQVGDKSKPLSSLKGQPVIIVFADSPSTRAFKRQTAELETMYDHFAASKVVFVAAFKEASQTVRSNIPFLVATQGEAHAKFGVQRKFAIAILGADGNLDYQTDQELHASRVREVLANSFTVQQAVRRK